MGRRVPVRPRVAETHCHCLRLFCCARSAASPLSTQRRATCSAVLPLCPMGLCATTANYTCTLTDLCCGDSILPGHSLSHRPAHQSLSPSRLHAVAPQLEMISEARWVPSALAVTKQSVCHSLYKLLSCGYALGWTTLYDRGCLSPRGRGCPRLRGWGSPCFGGTSVVCVLICGTLLMLFVRGCSGARPFVQSQFETNLHIRLMSLCGACGRWMCLP